MMLQVIWFMSVCLFGVWTDGTVNQAQPSSGSLNQTQKYGRFGFELAGIRSFLPEEELETRIIGGKVAWSHSWPWQACLRLTTIAACGGAIISPMWVVSAAHCFKRYKKASSWTVLAGKHDLDNPHENGQQMVGVSMIITHKAYNILTKENDLALLKLQQQLMFNEYVRPIDLWMAPLPLYSKCTITGWGSTRENGPQVPRLQEVNVTIMPSDVCNRYYTGRIRPSMFCAGKEGGGVDACQGDSGGPVSCYTGSRYELAGVISWGVGCGRARKPGVYARVQPHAQWISEVMYNQRDSIADDSTAEDSVCGKPQRSRCVRNPSPAAVSVPQDGPVSVVNVTESCPFTWCWMVSLQFSGHHFCSGALIHPSYVITSQHCNVRAEEDVAVLGIHDIRFSSSRIISIDKVFNLAQDHSFPPKADLSLLRLSRPARLGRNVCTICVPDEDEDEELDDSWTCIITGWGATKATATVDPNRLHHAVLTLINQTACNKMWEYALISDSHICTHPAGSTSCMGESGAPLFCRKHGDFFLFGLFTWGNRHCNADKPAVFSRVPRFGKWINEVLKDN